MSEQDERGRPAPDAPADPTNRPQGETPTRLADGADWCKRLAERDSAGKAALRIALLLLAEQRPRTGSELRAQLSISQRTLTRARKELDGLVRVRGQTWSLPRTKHAAQLGRVQRALRAVELEEAAAVWAPRWQRRFGDRFAELASLDDGALGRGCAFLARVVNAKRVKGVALRWDWALDDVADGAVCSAGAEQAATAKTDAGAENGLPSEALGLVARPGEWDLQHALAVVEAFGLAENAAAELLAARERAAGQVTAADWARQAAAFTLEFLRKYEP